MYLLLNNQAQEITIANSFFELKEHIIHLLFNIKSNVVLTKELQEVYEDVISRMYVAEDEEEVRKCIVTSNVYFNQKVNIL
ncbi:hypothetical protein [Salinicoccus albus]|uniref:hypothetical protein n=1 Tax=Salinicoccus albus TaxID=418756 RepID=UPI0003613189|nr:hypothetical protein [Salinicoccus albus]